MDGGDAARSAAPRSADAAQAGQAPAGDSARPPRVFGVAGCGVIGAGWAARALGRGLEVAAWDPAPGAETRLREAVAAAWPSLQRLGLYPDARPDRISFLDSPEAVGEAADFIQESAPEDENIKAGLLARLDSAAHSGKIIASSSSGLLPTRLAAGCAHPQRILIGHPFNPVYLLPLCEIVGGERTAPESIRRAADVYDFLDMHPLVVRREIEGYLSDRLQEALWRESLHLVNDGIADTGELDDSIIYGPGLRWAGMGVNLTFHLAGGAGGMRHMLRQFGPALQLPWTKLEAPPLTPALIEKMVEGTEEQAGGSSIAELERRRDDFLIAVMRALRSVNMGAGRILARREARRFGEAAAVWSPGVPIAAPLQLYRCDVEPDWVDYNNHMTEAAYLTAFGWASDALFRFIGDNESYRAAGRSFYTRETHINFLREVDGGDSLRFTTQIVGLDEKRLHFYHQMFNEETGELAAATEQMLLHVDTKAGRAAPIAETPARALAAVWEAHRKMEPPEFLGRVMKTRRS